MIYYDDDDDDDDDDDSTKISYWNNSSMHEIKYYIMIYRYE